MASSQAKIGWKTQRKREYKNCRFVLNFFAIFLEFSITSRVGTERTDNFYFFSFSTFSNLFWLEMKP